MTQTGNSNQTGSLWEDHKKWLKIILKQLFLSFWTDLSDKLLPYCMGQSISMETICS